MGHQALVQHKDTLVSQYCHRIHQNHPGTVATSSGQCHHNSLDLEIVKTLSCQYLLYNNELMHVKWHKVRSRDGRVGRRLAKRLSTGVSGKELPKPCVPRRH